MPKGGATTGGWSRGTKHTAGKKTGLSGLSSAAAKKLAKEDGGDVSMGGGGGGLGGIAARISSSPSTLNSGNLVSKKRVSEGVLGGVGKSVKKKEVTRRARNVTFVQKLAARAEKDRGDTKSGKKRAASQKLLRKSTLGVTLGTLQDLLPSLTDTLSNDGGDADGGNSGPAGGSRQGSSAASSGGPPKLTQARRAKIYKREAEQLSLVSSHPAFQSNPLGAIGEHVRNAVALVTANIAEANSRKQQQQQTREGAVAKKKAKGGSKSPGAQQKPARIIAGAINKNSGKKNGGTSKRRGQAGGGSRRGRR